MATPMVEFAGLRLDGQQAVAYWNWMCSNEIVDEWCRRSIRLTDNACWSDVRTYTDPVTDGAWWLDEDDPVSSMFCGAIILDVDGLQDPVVARAAYSSTTGGSALGPSTSTGRGVRIEGVLIGGTPEGLDYGRAALSQRVMAIAGSLLVRTTCPETRNLSTVDLGLVQLFNVRAVEQPTFTFTREESKTGCHLLMARFTLDLLAEDPQLYPVVGSDLIVDAVYGSLVSTDPAVTCPPVVVPSLVDPTAPAITTTTVTSTAAQFDDAGRPSCGDGSGYYDSGFEEVWFDLIGRPSAGDGSGHYLDVLEIAPEFDAYGLPSCGPRSGSWGAYPAVLAQDVVVAQFTQQTLPWTAQQITVAGLTPEQLDSLVVTIAPLLGGQVRSVTSQLWWSNENANPSRVAASSEVAVAPAQTVHEVYASPGDARPPLGWLAEFVVAWEHRIPKDATVEARYTTEATSSASGPNGGKWASEDAYGRPSCGPGSHAYLDEVIRFDSAGRPSCGTGSAFFMLEEAVDDEDGRPSCGPGSAHYLDEAPHNDWAGRASCGSGSANWMAISAFAGIDSDLTTMSAPEGVYSGSHTAGGVIPASSWNSGAIQAVSCSNAGLLVNTVTVTWYDNRGLSHTTLLRNNGAWPDVSGGFDCASKPNPSLPSTAVAVTSYTYTWQMTVGAGSGGLVVHLNLPAASAIPSPNGGADRACRIGPNAGADRTCNPGLNGGSDRACVLGPNAGVDVSCEGVDVECDHAELGPNNGTDRTLVTHCVSRLQARPDAFASGWPSFPARQPQGAIAHPGYEADMLPLLAYGEGAGIPGHTAPSGAFTFELGLSDLGLCPGTTILAARLCAKFTRPDAKSSSKSGTWRGYTIAAVAPAVAIPNGDLSVWADGDGTTADSWFFSDYPFAQYERIGEVGDRYVGMSKGSSDARVVTALFPVTEGEGMTVTWKAYATAPNLFGKYRLIITDGASPLAWHPMARTWVAYGSAAWYAFDFDGTSAWNSLPSSPKTITVEVGAVPAGYTSAMIEFANDESSALIALGHLSVTAAASTAWLYGGEFEQTGAGKTADEDGYTRWPLRVETYEKVNTMRVLCQLAAPSGGEGGSLDDLYVEVQAVGGPGCTDCGPNDGTDVPCPNTLDVSGMWTEPTSVLSTCATARPMRWHEHVPVVTLGAGTTDAAVMRNARIRFYDGATCDDDLRCMDPAATLEVPYVPAHGVLSIDGRTRTVSILVPGSVGPINALGLVYGGAGRAWTWPSFAGPYAVLVDLDESNTGPSASVRVAAAARRWQA